MKKTKKGFTLIELLVVVAIIGILAAIAIPQFANYRKQAANSAALSDAKTIAVEAESFNSEYGSYPIYNN